MQRCAPAEFERLHNELLSAKRKAAELAIVQEQLARQKQLWSDAEQRLAQLQVCPICRVVVGESRFNWPPCPAVTDLPGQAFEVLEGAICGKGKPGGKYST